MRTLGFVGMALALGAASFAGAAENGLVAHFTFDDAANFMYDRVQGKAIGMVYSTNHSDPEGIAAPTACEAPHVRGLQVAGGWWQNNYLVVDGASFGSAQGIPCGNQAVTYSLWIRPAKNWQSGGSLGVGTLCKLLRRGNDGYEWWPNYNTESLFIQKATDGLPKIVFGVGVMAADETSAGYTLPSGFDGQTWHFVAATYAERVLTLYYDGQKVAEKTLAGDVVLADNSPLIVGDVCSTFNDYCAYRYAGGLDDLKVYNRALTADEVAAAYQAGAVAFDTDVIVWDGNSAGGLATASASWATASNRRTAEEICAAGAVLDLTPLDGGGVLTQEEADATLKVKGVICTNGQRAVTLQMKAGALEARRPSTQRGLVAHFSFDDPDAEGRLVDSGTAGVTAKSGVWTYNGTESGARPIQSVEGVCGRAMEFPASGEWSYWPSTYVKTDAATTTKTNGIPAGGDPVTYSLWIRPYATERWNNGMLGLGDELVWVFRRGNYGNGRGTTLFLSKGTEGGTSAKLSWSIADWLGADGTCAYEPTDLFDGNWHHVVCAYADRTLTLYYDGVKVATKATEYALAMADGQPISLGNSTAGGNENENRRRYLGGFDEFKVFNVALTDDEVAAEYAQRSRTLDEASVGTVPSPVTVRLDPGATAEFLGYGHEYGSLVGAGAASVGPASALRLDGTFGLLGTLSGCGTVTASNWILGGDGTAFVGDFVVDENATITVSDADGQMLNAAFGGTVTLPKKAVVAWGRRPDAGEAVVTAAALKVPSDFLEWLDGTGRNVRVNVVGNTLRIKGRTGLCVVVR